MSHPNHADAGAVAHTHPPYMKIFALLVALTVIEVVIPFAMKGNHGLAVTLLIAISVVKILYIARYFMHLKFEARILGLVACAPLLCASILAFVLLWEF